VASRDRLWAFLELLALVGFVIAQPTLDVLGKAPDFFLFRRADRTDILLLVLAVTVLPATCMWLVELAGGLADRGDRSHRGWRPGSRRPRSKARAAGGGGRQW
jgi:hypothetical protein